MLCFFFSSRRRHTRYWRDWSSDVCSPISTYPDGFPEEIIARFESETGRGVIGNKPASGTRIIEELGPEQEKAGSWIVYTSAEVGRASCRERGEISVGAGQLKKKNYKSF